MKFSNPQYKRLPEVEFLVTNLARTIGINVIDLSLYHYGKNQLATISLRYDRYYDGKRLRRLHQEDFCQVMGIHGIMKYQQEGGPSLNDCLETIRKYSDNVITDTKSLLNWMVFNVLVGNCDSHGKNLAFVYKQGKTLLAPHYDLVSTINYPRVSTNLAMSIGGEQNVHNIRRSCWINQAQKMEYRKITINAKECYVNSKHLQQVKLTQGTSADLKLTDITYGCGPWPPTKKRPKDILIVLDTGHGGTDNGAVGPSVLKEKELTLKQVLLLKDVIKQTGYRIVLTRSTDDYVGLYDRVRAGYNKRADAFISIHYNFCPSQQNPREKRYISTFAWNNIGKELAKPVNTELGKTSPVRNAGVLYGNLAVCRNPAVPSILIELDFITTPENEELIQTTKFQREAAEAVLRGIQSWCGR